VRATALILATLLGLAVGSFVNVVLTRVPVGESVLRPGSRCPRCRTPIRARDNVPVASWILLRGRCRACRAPIPVRYPAVEVLGGVVGFVTMWLVG
jgi:leader peptidase (prepilin peptidase)/N-methyltransferase